MSENRCIKRDKDRERPRSKLIIIPTYQVQNNIHWFSRFRMPKANIIMERSFLLFPLVSELLHHK